MNGNYKKFLMHIVNKINKVLSILKIIFHKMYFVLSFFNSRSAVHIFIFLGLFFLIVSNFPSLLEWFFELYDGVLMRQPAQCEDMDHFFKKSKDIGKGKFMKHSSEDIPSTNKASEDTHNTIKNAKELAKERRKKFHDDGQWLPNLARDAVLVGVFIGVVVYVINKFFGGGS